MKKQTLYTSVWLGALLLALTLVVISHRGGRARTKSEARILEVAAAVETEPFDTGGDSADDTTLWLNPSDPAQSLVIGTNKKRGLAVYDLTGKEIQSLADGQMNNVDSRDELVTASNRSNNSIAIYRINAETRRLENVAAEEIKTIEAYGSCMYKSSKTGKLYYLVTSKQGVVEQYELFDTRKGMSAKRVRQIKVGSQLEGCVADDELGYLYVGEEDVAIWKYSAEPDAEATRKEVDRVRPGGSLVADVEGLTIAYGSDGKGYLIASSQGNSTFAIYRREGDNTYVKSFRIVAGSAVDNVTETDGIHVTTANLGPQFPNGVFIAQDGADDKGKQNFKLVPWQLIVAADLGG
ncbi:MAG TPA: phytase [Pyrinomonadaceae bacterium]|nr:phytase [Pyrinomonadaceae bacterium]